MGFLRPKVPVPPPAPNPASPAMDAASPDALTGGQGPYGTGSYIGTSSRGLQRRATTQRTSLIGGV
jgi:hypothetical protein